MKTKSFLALLSALLFTSIGHAEWITAINSGNWGDTNIWDTGTVPGTNDFAEVDSPYNVTVDTNAVVQYIFGSGTVTMGPGSTLEITDPLGANGTYQLATLDTSAPGNTVLYSNNPFWAKHQDYYNLVFSNTITTNQIDFYNGLVNSENPAAAMTIAGDMTVIGKIKVQQGADFAINGSLIMGSNSVWDCSLFNMTVHSNTTMGGLLLDLAGGSGFNAFLGNVTVTSNSVGWNVSDVTEWIVGGSLTNRGLIVGKGYGSISFDGAGVITGKPFKIPTISVNGTYTIGTTITLTTNTPTLAGTLVFDLANTNRLVLLSTPGNPLTLYYSANLNVINTGPAPASGNSYKFFNATAYDGAFSFSAFPSLPPGLSWTDDLLTSGSIIVSGSIAANPVITVAQYNSASHQLSLTWTSSPGATYSVEYEATLISGGFNTVLASAIPSGGAQTSTAVTMPAGSTGFVRISQQ